MVYNRNNSPERGVSPEGVARGGHSSRGGVIPVVHHTGMSYLFYYTKQHTKHKRGKIDKHQRFWINNFVKNLQITITGIVALTHQSEREAPKRTTGENFQFDSEKFWKHEQMSLLDVSLPFSNKICIRKLHLLIPPLNQSLCLCISKTLNLICLFVLLLSLLVRATLTVVPAVV